MLMRYSYGGCGEGRRKFEKWFLEVESYGERGGFFIVSFKINRDLFIIFS